MKYIAGSDAKSVEIAKAVVAKILALMEGGDWEEASATIDRAMRSPNKPFRIDFEAQAVAACIF